MSQKDGFEAFLSLLASCDYPIITPKYNMYNAHNNKNNNLLLTRIPEAIRKKGLENPSWALQTVDWFDGAFNAYSYEAFFKNNLLPYTEKFDSQSWWASQFITILQANHYYRNRIVQCNKIVVDNLQHSQYSQGLDIFSEAYRLVLDELGVSAIEMSIGKEIKINVNLDIKINHMKRRWFYYNQTIGSMKDFLNKIKNRIKRVLRNGGLC